MAAMASILSTSPAIAAEFSIKCRGEVTTFTAMPILKPTVVRKVLPDQQFIIDPDVKKVWRWLSPLNQRDEYCAETSCVSAFTDGKISLSWWPKDNALNFAYRFDLDRRTGHAVHTQSHGTGNELHYNQWDLMCDPAPIPTPQKSRF